MQFRNHFRKIGVATILQLIVLSFGFYCQPDLFASSGVLLNRSLISVGSSSYSAWDALFILCASNKVLESQVKISGEWLLTTKPPAIQKETAQAVFAKNPDLERFLFLVFAIEESQKLNLFLPTVDEIKKSSDSLEQAITACNWNLVSSKAKIFYENLPKDVREKWAENLLRARSFEQVRGGLGKNESLFLLNWTWLTTTSAP